MKVARLIASADAPYGFAEDLAPDDLLVGSPPWPDLVVTESAVAPIRDLRFQRLVVEAASGERFAVLRTIGRLEVVACAACGAEMGPDDAACPECEWIPEVEVADRQCIPEGSQPDPRRCDACGHRIPEGRGHTQPDDDGIDRWYCPACWEE